MHARPRAPHARPSAALLTCRRLVSQTTDRDARRVAALLFFNLACCTDTRVEVALEKGGLDHIAFLADVPDPLVGSGNNVASPALYAAKALVLMASVPELRPAIARHPGAMRALLRVFSTSPNRQLRHRAAKILQQLALVRVPPSRAVPRPARLLTAAAATVCRSCLRPAGLR